MIGIRESIGNHYKILKCGVLLYRYHIMKTIEDVYQKMKMGLERYPLSSGGQQLNSLQWSYLNQTEYHLNELFFQKSELVMHMIESMIDKSYYERIIR
jgi:hypothetical protein